MKEFISPDRIANAISMKGDSFNSFLVLEGESDYLLFKKFIDEEICKIEIGFGYEAVLEVVKLLNERSFNKVLGIIDKDFRELDNENIETLNILCTDFHDLEVSIINSDAFANVLTYHIQEKKLIEKYGDYNNFRNHLFKTLAPLSFLKWLNKKENLGIIFKSKNIDGKPLDFVKFICVTNLTYLGNELLIKSVLDYCNGKVKILIKEQELLVALEEVFNQDVDMYQLTNGHDLILLMAISLRKHVSNLNSKAITSEQIQRELFLAYEARFFRNSTLYSQIKEWELSSKVEILSV
ncbi:DUF4435 domain-containing protein [Sphingobacterium mizutaii]|uniref:DUF4435 domain-containing protein n=1 Tax=Sphingobacterium mizutaii TaxID=1010 RepID=UPI0028A2B71A|nr:DUF4435 domain-containing protein [Sphingobacterium mizutaii]